MDQNSGSKPKKRKLYTDEFRRSVVEYLLASDKPAAQVAKEFGITAGMLRVWKLRYGPRNPPSLPRCASTIPVLILRAR
jgi:transposase-like protein